MMSPSLEILGTRQDIFLCNRHWETSVGMGVGLNVMIILVEDLCNP